MVTGGGREVVVRWSSVAFIPIWELCVNTIGVTMCMLVCVYVYMKYVVCWLCTWLCYIWCHNVIM